MPQRRNENVSYFSKSMVRQYSQNMQNQKNIMMGPFCLILGREFFFENQASSLRRTDRTDWLTDGAGYIGPAGKQGESNTMQSRVSSLDGNSLNYLVQIGENIFAK